MRANRVLTVSTKEMVLPEFFSDNAIRLSIAKVEPDLLSEEIPMILAAINRFSPLSHTTSESGEFF